uniref:Uncharacterized protein n=1 Tax=Arundo donax TaxID=35708 RepID=A0A0A9G9U0_ARUDO
MVVLFWSAQALCLRLMNSEATVSTSLFLSPFILWPCPTFSSVSGAASCFISLAWVS